MTLTWSADATVSMAGILGKENVIRVEPSTVAEDFGKYGRTPEKVKIALFWLGGVNSQKHILRAWKREQCFLRFTAAISLLTLLLAYTTGVTACRT
ncbi:MAG: hypothetical protein MZV63_09195 [Marinilabiliales bacterium]|nr:hypothetical protein [Marinilabiliales bacterium]